MICAQIAVIKLAAAKTNDERDVSMPVGVQPRCAEEHERDAEGHVP